jgi:hypothetical protein
MCFLFRDSFRMDHEEEGVANGLFPSSPNVMTTTIAPDHFLLSTYKENLRTTSESHHDTYPRTLSSHTHGHMKASPSTYKCCLCRKIVDDATLTCAPCVNTGRFCPSKHDTCSSKRRQALVNMLNPDDQQEFQQYTDKHAINTPPHFQ